MSLPAPLDTRPCAACRGTPCCFDYRVAISAADAHRLARGRGLDLAVVTVLHPDPSGPIALNGRPDRFGLFLAKHTGGDHLGGCVFLTGPSGQGRCAVHPDRPMVCRQFPLRPHAGGFAFPDGPCPPVWERAHLDPAAATRQSGLWRVERALEARFLAGWNAIARCAPPGRSRTPRMLHAWLLTWFDQAFGALTATIATPDGQDALIARGLDGGPWALGLQRADELLADALREIQRRDQAPRGPTAAG